MFIIAGVGDLLVRRISRNSSEGCHLDCQPPIEGRCLEGLFNDVPSREPTGDHFNEDEREHDRVHDNFQRNRFGLRGEQQEGLDRELDQGSQQPESHDEGCPLEQVTNVPEVQPGELDQEHDHVPGRG